MTTLPEIRKRAEERERCELAEDYPASCSDEEFYLCGTHRNPLAMEADIRALLAIIDGMGGWNNSRTEFPPVHDRVLLSWGYDSPVIGWYSGEDDLFGYEADGRFLESRRPVWWHALPQAPERLPDAPVAPSTPTPDTPEEAGP